MRLAEYAIALGRLAKKYPDADVVYSSDEEGNSFDLLIHCPTTGKFKNGEFEYKTAKKDVNAVCVN